MAQSQAATAATEALIPVSEISTYLRRWAIRARVASKAPLRTFARRGGGGGGDSRVFHVELMDGMGEIRASFFNEAADQYFDVLQVGKVYTFSRGNVKVANRQYNICNHRYEITYDRNAQIAEVEGEVEKHEVKFSFVDVRAVRTKSLPCRVDLCGVVMHFYPATTVMSKDGRELLKRNVTIADDTATSMEITLWGEKAKIADTDFEGHPVVGFKGIILKEWNGGLSGSTSESGAVIFRPDVPEAKRIEQWWKQGGSRQELVSLRGEGGRAGGAGGRGAEQCTVGEMRRKAELVTDQVELYSTTARLALVQTKKQGEMQPLHYLACVELKEGSSRPCNRRVDSTGFCAACNKIGKAAPRMHLRCRFADFAEGAWLTTFHEAAKTVAGMSADEVAKLDSNVRSGGDVTPGREQLELAMRKRYFIEPMHLRVRAKLDVYNGDPRSNVTCISAAAVNPRDHGRKLLGEIQQLLAH